MSQHNFKQKVGSIMVILALVSSGLFMFILPNSIFSAAIDAPSSTERKDNDFVNGTFDKLTLIDNNNKFELTLDMFESSNWTKKSILNRPRARGTHAMADVYGTDKIVIFGGEKDGGGPLGDTWVYDLSDNTWIDQSPKNSPPPRIYLTMASIWGTDKVLIFGGHGGEGNDTWIYDLSDNNWTRKNPVNKIRTTYLHRMASIYGTDKVLLFGGWIPSSGSPSDETWIYDLSNNTWTNVTTNPIPDRRYVHAMATIDNTDKVLLFGGYKVGSLKINDTWIFDLSDNKWVRKSVSIAPNERYGHTMAPIFGSDRVLLFSGPNINGMYNDNWIYDLSENKWIEIEPITKPPGMQYHKMTAVYNSNEIVLFGGSYPANNETWIFKPDMYVDNGTYMSPLIEVGSNFSFKSISWNGSVPYNTSIRFQLRSANFESNISSKPFVGPDGFITSYYTTSFSEIWPGHNGDRWVQYMAYFSTKNKFKTPRLMNVTLSYNYWPNTTLVAPVNKSKDINNKPNFKWNFTDSDSKYQSSFQVLIDDDENFKSIDFDSDEQSSTNTTWNFPNQTGYSKIPDGTWYWKVRTKDNDGDWGLYSPPWKMIIDTKTPNSTIAIPINDSFYNNLDYISGLANEVANGSGIYKVEITIKDLNEDRYWNGDGWVLEKNWLSTNGTNKWTYNSSSITWASGSLYHVRSKAIDNTTNIEIPGIGNIFTFDKDNVVFSNTRPKVNDVSSKQKVEIGVTISDSISGVNASSIQYAVSEDSGSVWGSWVSIEGLNNQMDIDVALNLTFPNGTGNRIKWRASDIIGNGPKESNVYVVKVNTWLPTPRVSLWNPKNGSVIQTNSVELHWMLETWKLTNISYDVYFDTNNPPAMKHSGVINTSFNINDLSNGRTYYWTVIPKIGTRNGTCLSGVWSFTVDIPIPSITMISPTNGSVIQALRPTFVWSVNYDGTEELTYDIYLGKNNSLEIEIFDYYDSNYLSKNVLEYNETYNWKIVPKAGGLEGFESEIWWFTLRSKEKESIPRFEFELKLDPTEIELGPDETRYVKAIVTNLGEFTDKIVLSIPELPISGVDIEINEPKIIEVSTNGTAEFNISVRAQDDALEDEILITVVAASTNAAGYNQVVEKRATLTVKILSQTKHDTGKSTDASWYWILLLIIFVILIVLFFVGLIIKRKQKPEQEPPPSEASTPESEIEVPRTPEIVPEVVTAAPTTIPIIQTIETESTPPIQAIPTPTPMPGQTPQPQIPKAPEQPQLPPAQNDSESQPEVTEQPIDQQIPNLSEEKVGGENNK